MVADRPSTLKALLDIGIAAASSTEGLSIILVSNTLDPGVSTYDKGGFRSVKMLVRPCHAMH